MISGALVLAVVALLASSLLTALVRRLAVAHGVLDIPNERSSHGSATPRGGGLAIVVTTTGAVLGLAIEGSISRDLCMALVGGGIAVAIVGFMDDRFAVRASVRLVVHLLAAAWAVYWLGGLTAFRLGDHTVVLGWTADVLAVLGIAWVLNLFNFMDGIDGIAASEAVFVACAGALLPAVGRAVIDAASVFAGACAGFLLWNWPPAKIFLGDVGSGYLGYVIAVLALAASRNNSAVMWAWLILGGIFFVDATVTLGRRLWRGARPYEAHRTHAYQRLARRWRSHAKVTIAVVAVNVGWLLPWAELASRRPDLAVAAVLLAFAPLTVLAVALGSGSASHEHQSQ
jgi:Fuc2NAc and GlcNAc transferase